MLRRRPWVQVRTKHSAKYCSVKNEKFKITKTERDILLRTSKINGSFNSYLNMLRV